MKRFTLIVVFTLLTAFSAQAAEIRWQTLSNGLPSQISTDIPAKKWFVSPVKISIQKEISGETAVVSEQGTCDAFGITLKSNLHNEGDWIAWNLDLEGTQPPTGYTLILDFPVLENATHIFTPSDNGTANLSLMPTHKPAQYGAIVHPYKSSFVLPLAGVFDVKQDTALTIALPADANIPFLQVEWFDGKILRFIPMPIEFFVFKTLFHAGF